MKIASRDHDRAVDAAIRKSHLARLEAPARDALLSRSSRVEVPARSVFYRAGAAPKTALLLSGLGRIGFVNEAGEDLTIRWAHAGEWIGPAMLVEPERFLSSGLFAQAVTDLVYLDIPADAVRELALADAKVAWVIAQALALRLDQAIDDIIAYAQGDLRSRIVRRLLELAVHQPAGAPLIASITQEDLAKAVGAARPSVARVLAALKQEGSIRAVRGGLLITRPDELTTPSRIGAA